MTLPGNLHIYRICLLCIQRQSSPTSLVFELLNAAKWVIVIVIYTHTLITTSTHTMLVLEIVLLYSKLFTGDSFRLLHGEPDEIRCDELRCRHLAG